MSFAIIFWCACRFWPQRPKHTNAFCFYDRSTGLHKHFLRIATTPYLRCSHDRTRQCDRPDIHSRVLSQRSALAQHSCSKIFARLASSFYHTLGFGERPVPEVLFSSIGLGQRGFKFETIRLHCATVNVAEQRRFSSFRSFDPHLPRDSPALWARSTGQPRRISRTFLQHRRRFHGVAMTLVSAPISRAILRTLQMPKPPDTAQ